MSMQMMVMEKNNKQRMKKINNYSYFTYCYYDVMLSFEENSSYPDQHLSRCAVWIAISVYAPTRETHH